MTDIGKIEIITRPIPEPGADEVLIKLEFVGICGSDVHYFEHGRIGDYIVKPPFVLGHEAGGAVVKTGADVTSLNVGDRVALEPGKTCGKCGYCKAGKYNLCPDVIFFATPPVDGVFQEYVTHPAELCFKLPDKLSTIEGALIEPLAVGFHAAAQSGASTGQKAVVFGSGCIGLVCMMALLAHGVTTVYQVDRIDKRLEKALELGAAGTVNSAKEDPVEWLNRHTGGQGCDIAIDTSGSEAALNQAVQATRKGGVVVMVGYSVSGRMNLQTSLAMDKEIRFETVFRYRNVYKTAIDAVAEGKVNLAGVATDFFDLDELQYALEQCISNKDNVVKAVVKVSMD